MRLATRLLVCALSLPMLAAPGGPAAAPEAPLAPTDALRALAPAKLPPPPDDPSNRFAGNSAAARLGQRLFFDPRFSGPLLEGDNDGGANALGRRGESGRVACAGCHVASAGFLDNRSLGRQVSLGAGWTPRRAPSLLDVAQSRLLHWDGSHDSSWSQIFGPLEHDNEMNSGRLFVAEQLFRNHRVGYEALFGPMPPLGDAARFPPLAPAQAGCQIAIDAGARGAAAHKVCHGLPGDGAEFDGLTPADQDAVTAVVVNAGKAIGAYLRLLSCGPGRFDRWVAGDAAALTPLEQRGALLFAGKAGCVRCHSGPYLSDEQFHNAGLAPQTVAVVIFDRDDHGAAAGLAQLRADPLNSKGRFSDGDDGRLPASIPAAALGAFRTPRLRCASLRPSFMHTGQLRTLEEVVAFFDRGGHPFGFPGKSELKPLGLDASERAALVAFLRSLDGPGPERVLLAPPP